MAFVGCFHLAQLQGMQEGCVAAALHPALREPPASVTLGRDSGCQVGNVCISVILPLGFAIQEMAQCAQGAVAVMPPGGSHCCPFAALPSGDLTSAHLLFLRESPTTAGTCWLWQGSCQSRDRVGAARSDPVPWSLGQASPLARVGELGLGLAWG